MSSPCEILLCLKQMKYYILLYGPTDDCFAEEINIASCNSVH